MKPLENKVVITSAILAAFIASKTFEIAIISSILLFFWVLIYYINLKIFPKKRIVAQTVTILLVVTSYMIFSELLPAYQAAVPVYFFIPFIFSILYIEEEKNVTQDLIRTAFIKTITLMLATAFIKEILLTGQLTIMDITSEITKLRNIINIFSIEQDLIITRTIILDSLTLMIIGMSLGTMNYFEMKRGK